MAKVWEEWAKDLTPDVAVHPVSGEPLEIWTEYEGFIDDIFTFYETVKNARTDEILIRKKMQLKFRTQEDIYKSLQQVGFSHSQVYGDWKFEQATTEAKSFIFHCVK